jgi:hypothetical protein
MINKKYLDKIIQRLVKDTEVTSNPYGKIYVRLPLPRNEGTHCKFSIEEIKHLTDNHQKNLVSVKFYLYLIDTYFLEVDNFEDFSLVVRSYKRELVRILNGETEGVYH